MTSLGGRDYNGKVVARAGVYVATQRKGQRFCSIRVWGTIDHPNAGRVVGVAHDAAAARAMVLEMAGGR
jgi:hypothetical protein